MRRGSCRSRWGQRLAWSCRREYAASLALVVRSGCRSGGRTNPGRAGEPTRAPLSQIVALQCSFAKIHLYNDSRISRFRRIGRLVLLSKRTRIARPSSLDEGRRRRMATKLLGIDVGTGGTRAVLVDEAGRVLGAATAEHAEMASPELGWAEQDPRGWWRAACVAIAECLTDAGATPAEVSAVGLSGQMHGLVLLDAAGGGVGGGL